MSIDVHAHFWTNTYLDISLSSGALWTTWAWPGWR